MKSGISAFYGIAYYLKSDAKYQCASYYFDLKAFKTLERSTIKKIALEIADSLFNTKPLMSKTVVKAPSINANCLIVCLSAKEYICAFTSQQYPERIGFNALTECIGKYDKKSLQQITSKYYTPSHDILFTAQQKAESVKETMQDCLTKMVATNEETKELEIKSEELKELAKTFEKASKRKKCCIVF